jgi:putative N6-adenine-specific DNA methylase
MDFDVALWTALRDEARRGVLKQLPAPIVGSDVRSDAVSFATGNGRAAGIGHLVKFERRDLLDFRPPLETPGTLLTNPPYGERLGEERELKSLYRLLGEVLRERCAGWSAFAFVGNANLAREIGLPIAEQTPLFNGKIPCRLLRLDLS